MLTLKCVGVESILGVLSGLASLRYHVNVAHQRKMPGDWSATVTSVMRQKAPQAFYILRQQLAPTLEGRGE